MLMLILILISITTIMIIIIVVVVVVVVVATAAEVKVIVTLVVLYARISNRAKDTKSTEGAYIVTIAALVHLLQHSQQPKTHYQETGEILTEPDSVCIQKSATNQSTAIYNLAGKKLTHSMVNNPRAGPLKPRVEKVPRRINDRRRSVTIRMRKIVILFELVDVVQQRSDMVVHGVDSHTQARSTRRGSIGDGKEKRSGNCKGEPLHLEWIDDGIL